MGVKERNLKEMHVATRFHSHFLERILSFIYGNFQIIFLFFFFFKQKLTCGGRGFPKRKVCVCKPAHRTQKILFPLFFIALRVFAQVRLFTSRAFPSWEMLPPVRWWRRWWIVECGMWMDTVTVDGSYSNIGEKWGILVIFNVPLFF